MVISHFSPGDVIKKVNVTTFDYRYVAGEQEQEEEEGPP
jgi:hypothetical protein